MNKDKSTPSRRTVKPRKARASSRLGLASGSLKTARQLPLKNAEEPRHVIEFKLFAPEAAEVFVAGSFNDWSPTATPLARVSGGEWLLVLCLKPGVYEYRFVVDGRWIEDPNASQFCPNPFGERNSVLPVA